MQIYTKESIERMIKSWPETIRTLKVLARVNRLHRMPHAELTRAAGKLEKILQEYRDLMVIVDNDIK